ncbi:MAG: hypothetical protein LC734_03980, partial [Acidobacteria bacterium]|nr:hypothetical protein [Acidobacteriota bacterium]
MKNLSRIFFLAPLLALLALAAAAQQVKRTPFDVQHYVVDASLAPADQKLTATVDVTFVPLEETRTVTFELNGSLKVESVLRVATSTLPTAIAPRGRAARPAAA